MSWSGLVVAVIPLVLACGSRRDPGEACDKSYHCEFRCLGGVCTSGTAGAACRTARHCSDPLVCVAKACRARGHEGDACEAEDHCLDPLTCYRWACVSPATAAAGEARDLAEQRDRKAKENAEKTARMLDRAGVGSAATAEAVVHPPAPGSRVRTVKIVEHGHAFAACKPGERLIGGGCDASAEVKASFPSGHSEEDTVGARWNCRTREKAEISAYALCTSLP